MIKPEVDYFDHDADIGIIGRGDSIEAAFCAAACAVFKIMTDITSVQPQYHIDITFEETNCELALVTWINTLLAKSHELELIFCKFELSHTGSKWIGTAYGDTWQETHPRGTEVKGATVTMLKVFKNSQWEARCVVDV